MSSRKWQVAGLVVFAVIAGALAVASLRQSPPVVDQQAVSSTPTPTSDPGTIAFLGDSYAAGVGAAGGKAEADPTAGFAGQVAAELGTRHEDWSQGGTGYLNPGQRGESAFPDRAASAADSEPDVIVVQGGGNDALVGGFEERLPAAVRQTLATLERDAPDAEIVVMGPVVAPNSEADKLRAVSQILAAEADRAGVEYVNALDWLPDASLFIRDGYHPNAGGHTVIADRLVSALG